MSSSRGPQELGEFLTVAEVAAMLQLNQQTIRNWIDAGKLPAFRVGRRVRIGRADFEAIVEAGYTGGAIGEGAASPPDRYTAEQFWDGVAQPAPGIAH